MSQSEKLDATTVAIACGEIQKALQGKVVLSKYSETVGLIFNISTGNPHEILKLIRIQNNQPPNPWVGFFPRI